MIMIELEVFGIIKKHSGKGKTIRGSFGEPGYQEVINFEEFIGYSICDKIKEKNIYYMGKNSLF